MKYLPSKSFLVIIAVIVAIGGIFGVYWVSQKTNVSFERTTDVSSGNWKSTISKNTVPSLSSENITENAAQSLLSDYLTTRKDAGEALSPSEREQVALDLAKKVSEESVQKPAYVLGDITLTEDGPDAYRAYGNDLGGLFSSYSKNYPDNEITLMRQAFASGDPSDFAKLSPNATAYRTLAKNLAKVPAPRSLAGAHLKLMNGYAGVGQALTDVQILFQDSVRGMVAISLYDQGLKMVADGVTELTGLFKKNNVVFTKEESGSVFKTP